MTTSPRPWRFEYQLLLDRAEDLSRELGRFDAARAALELRLHELEERLRAQGSAPERDEELAALVDGETVAAADEGDGATDATASAQVLAQFLIHVEALARALGKHESESNLLEYRLARLSGQFDVKVAADATPASGVAPPSNVLPIDDPGEVVAVPGVVMTELAAVAVRARDSHVARFEAIADDSDPRAIRPARPGAVILRAPFGSRMDAAMIALPIVVLLAMVVAFTQLRTHDQPATPNPLAEHATAGITPSRSYIGASGGSGVTPTSSHSAHAAATASQQGTTVSPNVPSSSPTSVVASSTDAGTSPATAAPSVQPTTPPSPDSQLATQPAAATTTSPAPTATPPIATETTIPASLVPGGVGSTRAQIELTFGPQEGANDAGEAVYQDSTVFILYSPGGVALRVTFDVSGDDLSGFDQAAAESLAAFYRPPDAILLNVDPTNSGIVRNRYSSQALAAALAGQDTISRDPGAYVEELRSDPATGRPLAIVMALGQAP